MVEWRWWVVVMVGRCRVLCKAEQHQRERERRRQNDRQTDRQPDRDVPVKSCLVLVLGLHALRVAPQFRTAGYEKYWRRRSRNAAGAGLSRRSSQSKVQVPYGVDTYKYNKRRLDGSTKKFPSMSR